MRYKLSLTLALFLPLWTVDLRAATITVTSNEVDYKSYQSSGAFRGTYRFVQNGRCTIIEAVVAANTDTATGDCPAGNGNDTIVLRTGAYVFNPGSVNQIYDHRVFPEITGNITISGQGSSADETRFSRSAMAALNFGFFRVAPSGNLTLNNMKLKYAIAYSEEGGALRNNGGSVTLNNVIIYENGISSVPDYSSSSSSLIHSYRGGGLANLAGGSMTLNNCVIEDNGNSGIYNAGFSSSLSDTNQDSHLIINNSTITGNVATPVSNTEGGSGAGIHNLGKLEISGSFITGNQAESPSSPSIMNFCHSNGGGIYDAHVSTTISINNTTIANNTARCGGGIYLAAQVFPHILSGNPVYGSSTLDRVSLYNNSAGQSGSVGGYGGGVYHSSGSLTLSNTSLIGNQAYPQMGPFDSVMGGGTGGGIYKAASNTAPAAMPTNLINVTVKDNSAHVSGGGIWIHPSDTNGRVNLKNTIVEGNNATVTPMQRNCNGYGNSMGNNLYAPGNISEDCTNNRVSSDKFTDPALGGLVMDLTAPARIYYPMSINSPARDAGTNSGTPLVDQSGFNRMSTRDIGASEYTCGDVLQAAHEECDDGNDDNSDDCTTLCQLPACGDGFVQPGNDEDCDDSNTITGDGCSNLCVVEECGDGIVHAGLNEQCDDGNTFAGDGCNASCEVESVCGNGLPEDPEACDDGNTANGDGCSTFCLVEECGDGVLQAALAEECDDGNDNENDSCTNTCEIILCGNGTKNTDHGEQCDDANRVNNDGCNSECQLEICGDSVLQSSRGEQCDDGNTVANDGCGPTCRREVCGDRIVQSHREEQCDDGNRSNTDDCVRGCVVASCGDGFVRAESRTPEPCDDGNVENGDGCSASCEPEAAAAESAVSEPEASETPAGEPASEPVSSDALTGDPESSPPVTPPADDLVLPEAGDDILSEEASPAPESSLVVGSELSPEPVEAEPTSSEPAQAQSAGETAPAGGAKSGCQLSQQSQASVENFLIFFLLFGLLGALRLRKTIDRKSFY